MAAAGAQRAAHADGKAPEEGSALAATAAGIAAAKAGKGSGAGGVQLASLIATSALAASAVLAPEEKLKSVHEALRRTAEDTGLGAEALEKLAKQTVPAAAAGNTAGSAATSSSDHSKGSPYKQAEQAGRAAFDQAAAEHLSSEEQIAAAHKASKDAATAAGMSPEEAEKIADAVANAVSGGATEEMDPDLVVTIAPSATGKVVAGNNNGYPPLEDRVFREWEIAVAVSTSFPFFASSRVCFVGVSGAHVLGDGGAETTQCACSESMPCITVLNTATPRQFRHIISVSALSISMPDLNQCQYLYPHLSISVFYLVLYV